MRWRGERQSTNIEDRRGVSGGKIAVGGGLGTLLILVIALLIVAVEVLVMVVLLVRQMGSEVIASRTSCAIVIPFVGTEDS